MSWYANKSRLGPVVQADCQPNNRRVCIGYEEGCECAECCERENLDRKNPLVVPEYEQRQDAFRRDHMKDEIRENRRNENDE